MPTRSSRFAVAVHVLTLLAWAGDEPLKSARVAASVNTNAVVIRRILCALRRARLVVSQPGAAGGSKLARRPTDITLRDVYQAVAGGAVFGLHRRRPNQRCPVGAHIEPVLDGVLSEVDEAVARALAQTTMADIVAQIRPCEPQRRRGKNVGQ